MSNTSRTVQSIAREYIVVRAAAELYTVVHNHIGATDEYKLYASPSAGSARVCTVTVTPSDVDWEFTNHPQRSLIERWWVPELERAIEGAEPDTFELPPGFDDTDQRIFKLITEKPKMTNKQIGREIGMHPNNVSTRRARLNELTKHSRMSAPNSDLPSSRG